MASILIADGNPQARKFLHNILEAWSNLRVCGEAVDGLDAIDKAKELKPDIIAVDLSMPRMNGLVAARELRAINAEVSIILLALFADTPPSAEVKVAGVNAAFSKEDLSEFMKYI